MHGHEKSPRLLLMGAPKREAEAWVEYSDEYTEFMSKNNIFSLLFDAPILESGAKIYRIRSNSKLLMLKLC
jgi:hypothetical protein